MVVCGWNLNILNLCFIFEEIQGSLLVMVNDMCILVGLYWYCIVNLQDGIICNDMFEGVLEVLFRLFECNFDLLVVLIYVNEGFNMVLFLMVKGEKFIGVGIGLRQLGELIDIMVVLIVGCFEWVDWLCQFVFYIKVNENWIDFEFCGWGWCKLLVEFCFMLFIFQFWIEWVLEQWDVLLVLVRLYWLVSVLLICLDIGEWFKCEVFIV